LPDCPQLLTTIVITWEVVNLFDLQAKGHSLKKGTHCSAFNGASSCDETSVLMSHDA
jgi:hypothetical protein